MTVVSHAHPCNFRKHRRRDRGWGELAFEYRWDSTSGCKSEDGVGCPDLEHCRLYEITSYTGCLGTYEGGFFHPPDPPFIDWRFRDPTDGRTEPVGYECFIASQGWAWDRHKLGGRLIIPKIERDYTITAVQHYRFCCDLCGADLPMIGPDAGPHSVVRTFAPRAEEGAAPSSLKRWRYTLSKHDCSAWMDLDDQGYVADSAGIGFGPWDCHGV